MDGTAGCNGEWFSNGRGLGDNKGRGFEGHGGQRRPSHRQGTVGGPATDNRGGSAMENGMGMAGSDSGSSTSDGVLVFQFRNDGR